MKDSFEFMYNTFSTYYSKVPLSQLKDAYSGLRSRRAKEKVITKTKCG